jgi:hypothetical protein
LMISGSNGLVFLYLVRIAGAVITVESVRFFAITAVVAVDVIVVISGARRFVLLAIVPSSTGTGVGRSVGTDRQIHIVEFLKRVVYDGSVCRLRGSCWGTGDVMSNFVTVGLARGG